MTIPKWPVYQQPREKLLIKGAESLSDAELLAILLQSGITGMSAVELAQALLNQFGSLTALFNASLEDVCQLKGIGKAKYVQFQVILEVASRQMYERLQRGEILSRPSDTRRYLMARLSSLSQEVFACLFLDNQNRIISFDKMFYGTIDGACVYSREVVKLALKKNAAAVIFAHNHPSGVAEPSRADREITARLTQALSLLDIRVLDHFIIGDEIVSFAERGLL